jgi:hypothetical protein
VDGERSFDPPDEIVGFGGIIGRSWRIGPGTYSIVACVPELALASPVGTLRVLDNARATDVHVITYAVNGTSMG